MNKGISLYFGFNDDIEQRIQKIKQAGFDCIITNADKSYNFQNGTITKQIKLIKKYNLLLSSLHMTYKSEDLKHFFMNDKIGKRLEKSLINDLKIAHKYNFICVVVHMKGEYNNIGEQRLNRILDKCKKYNIPLAIENIDNQKLFKQIFKNHGDNPYLKFCYDSGHNHFFDPKFDYLTKYGKYLICLHLHDNDGTKDMHTLNKFGNIDWNKISTQLKKHPNINLDYEIIRPNIPDENQALNEIYNQAKILENLINN